jgi:glycosyltransferase involved in cell wall biosynthesis
VSPAEVPPRPPEGGVAGPLAPLFAATGLAGQALAVVTKLLLALVVLLVAWDVFSRNFTRPVAWSVSLTEYLLIYIAFLPMPALVRGKGHEAAIAAIARIGTSAERPIVFVAAGDGKLAADIRAKADAAGLATRFPGTLSPDDLRAALSAADVVLHPSDMETFGMSVAEAMACGRPVIATAVGGVPEITGHSGRAGLLVPLGDVDALADAVRVLLADPARRAAMGDAARRRIESRFPLSAMVEGYERLFLRLADRA